MKAKVYPLSIMPSVATTFASPFSTQLEIVIASLAKGTTTIKSIANNSDINTTIQWCESLGAIIKRNENSLVIKGVAQKISFSEPLFKANDSVSTALIMIPILCTISQPFGVTGNKQVIDELAKVDDILKGFGVDSYYDYGMKRYEKIITPTNLEINGDVDINFIAGLFITLASLKGNSVVRLRAPVRYERTYNVVLKVLKKFYVDIKHPNTMRYEINGKQTFQACKITTEIDNRMLAYTFLLARKIEETEKGITIHNYNYKNKNMDDYPLLDFVRTNAIVARRKGLKRVYAAKEMVEADTSIVTENKMSFLMMIATLCKTKMTINKLHLDNRRQKEQYKIALDFIKKMGVKYTEINDGIIINGQKIENKIQLDSQGNPFVAMDLCILGLLSDYPITVKQVECIERYSLDFFDILKEYGAKIEFIHD